LGMPFEMELGFTTSHTHYIKSYDETILPYLCSESLAAECIRQLFNSDTSMFYEFSEWAEEKMGSCYD
jgi:hypothetical protein